MSSQFLVSLFPHLSNFAQYSFPVLWDNVFPHETQVLCADKPLMLPGDISIRWPYLVPLQLLGIAIGCSALSFRRLDPAWINSFLFFACMNFAALLCHCVLPYDNVFRNIFWHLDVGFTGAASICAVLATQLQREQRGDYSFAIGLAIVTCTLVGNAVQIPWLNEVIYFGSTGLATISVGVYLISMRFRTGKQTVLLVFLIVQGLIVSSGPLIDKHLCEWLGPSFNCVHLLFLGCDLVYIVLLRLLSTS